jgi:hypothetical protein
MSAQRKKRKARRAVELERTDNRSTRDDHYAGVFKVVMQKGGQLVKGGLNYQEAHELWKNTPGTIFVYQ